MRQRRFGFSLVELLVVIAIIALLMAILLPVLTRVRRMARATVCLTHLQQLDAAYHMYVNANHNHSLPQGKDITSLMWFELLQPYCGNIQGVLLCPEATEPGNMLGSAFMAWGPRRTYSVGEPKWIERGVYTGSYGFNEWLQEPRPEVRPLIETTLRSRFIDLPTVQSDRVPVFGDAIDEWAAPDSTDTPPYSLINPLPFNSGLGPPAPGPKGMMAYFCIDRHFHAINVAFLDGHVERVTLEDLWKLRWNNLFRPKQVVLP
ncbi:MAG TPA: type II secretion system protein [Tepidisphaeraceae bacterium]|nr:type II secretion system protein [Tepidisphaeraceae bacterium]